MSELSQYFGQDGAFSEACAMYQQRYALPLPEDVLKEADAYTPGRLPFTLGYCFAVVLEKRSMAITDDALREISVAKINSTDPIYFFLGFKFHGSRVTDHESP
jgi:hypothetical protein